MILGSGMLIAVINALFANIRRLRGTNRQEVFEGVNRVLVGVILIVALGGGLMIIGKILAEHGR